ncbi:hypothetical protein RDE2_07850 [Rhodococcus sp. RDE2]|nr:hypothetical protein RDE2_07850 [Rhodococcus sp. RDE2]
MKRTILAALCAVLLLSGCSSEPSVEERRAEACELFASVTPGSLELQEATSTLADASAPSEDRADALHFTMQFRSGAFERGPYDCNEPADQKWFEEHFGRFDE